ncbi:MAG: hypothetical protein CND43_01195 [Flavobacteriales bacterium MED-G15]|mgnify:CR=1|nr:MAG: hypothetical protein CND43_01195 [Flavobacteriales bacterium MED-G15]|tara:strand:+ start:8012 stop:8296 length:285 start_codon:yes stop_codon:yes gene_type:complete
MKLFKTLQDYFISQFYVMIPASILILACVGSFSVYFLSVKGYSFLIFFQMTVCVAAAMCYLAFLLAQFKKEILFKTLIIALLIESVILAINLAV